MNPLQVAAGFVGGILTYSVYNAVTEEDDDDEDVDDDTAEDFIALNYLEHGPRKCARWLVSDEWCDDLETARETVSDWETASENKKVVAKYKARAERRAAAAAAAEAEDAEAAKAA